MSRDECWDNFGKEEDSELGCELGSETEDINDELGVKD